jgi:hypothetical protein
MLKISSQNLDVQYITKKAKMKTYDRGDSQLVTVASTDPPICSLCKAERTGCPVLYSLWSYVLDTCTIGGYMPPGGGGGLYVYT